MLRINKIVDLLIVLFLSSALSNARDNLKLFENIGTGWRYDYTNLVLLNGVNNGTSVGYKISSKVDVSSVWEDPNSPYTFLLKFNIISPKLYIKSRKAPTPEGYIHHVSPLESFTNQPFYALWKSGKINGVYLNSKEPISLLNLKKALVSSFQFQILDETSEENDSSGQCTVTYTSNSPEIILKTKQNCKNDYPQNIYSSEILSNSLKSTREISYEINMENHYLESINLNENHLIKLNLWEKAGGEIETLLTLKFESNIKSDIFKFENLQLVLNQIEKQSGRKLVKDMLALKRVDNDCKLTKSCLSFKKILSQQHEFLKNDQLGSLKSANAFLKLLNAARYANSDELVSILSNEENNDIMLQIYDILGFSQSSQAYKAVMKVLRFENEEHLDKFERYLWALSMGSQPKESILEDLLKKSQLEMNEKLEATVLLTLGSLANKLAKMPTTSQRSKIIRGVKDKLITGIETCESDECKKKHILALKNIKCDCSIPVILKYATSHSRMLSSISMKVLQSYPKEKWDENVLRTCFKIFYRQDYPYDSSARISALDIILETFESNSDVIEDLVVYLKSNDPSFEVKQYLLQRLLMIGDKNNEFKRNLTSIVKKHSDIYNYNVLAQKGMSTALQRSFIETDYLNGSLVSFQEINGGVLKRGSIQVRLEKNGISNEILNLGLFSAGLGNHPTVAENEMDPSIDLEEEATGGLDITILGTQIRPFIFFVGQGELMGHVWSGTASERTPAYQALIMLQDHLEYLPLSNGFVVESNILGVISFDLSGHVQFSLWNRNAQNSIEERGGLIVNGLLKIDTEFVKSEIESKLNSELNLNFAGFVDFGRNPQLCLQLSQPDTIIKFNTHKIERIPNTKHKIRISKYVSYKVPGKTYNLNRKNNEMCNVILKNENNN